MEAETERQLRANPRAGDLWYNSDVPGAWLSAESPASLGRGQLDAAKGEEKMIGEFVKTADWKMEKHVPVITTSGSTVRVAVGSVEHPMIEKHYIQWIYLQTTHGGQRYILKPGDKPEAVFALAEGAAPLAAYAYCNLHGLWTAKL